MPVQSPRVATRGMEKLITPAQLAEILGVKLPTIYTWVSRRRIPFQKVGHLLRFSPCAIDEWLLEQAEKPQSRELP